MILCPVTAGVAQALHVELDGFDRIGWFDRIVLLFIIFNKNAEHFQQIKFRRARLSIEDRFDLGESLLIIL